MAESWKIHLVAVTSNGRRAYFTTFANMRSSYGEERDLTKVPRHFDPRVTRPSTLVTVEARGPLPQAPVSGARVSTDPNRLGCGSGMGCVGCGGLDGLVGQGAKAVR
jgi:hypothetical protein